MSHVIDQWASEHEAEHGPTGAFVGFEEAICGHDCYLDAEYHEMSTDGKVLLFEFICKLLEREHEAGQ